jgi:dihydropteroate synthase
MGILNVTPDSFSDGGQFIGIDAALYQVEHMISSGANIIDIGGESTRPGAAAVTLAEELDRVIPIIAAIRQRFDIVISVDTYKTDVMSAAIATGADLINDVNALQSEGALAVVANAKVPVCLMHMQGQPTTMQDAPSYKDVVADVQSFFTARVAACAEAGISPSQIILDPGFGFGKTLAQNYELLRRFSDFSNLGLPLLAGLSRKSMIGNLLNRPVTERLAGSIACATIAVLAGAKIIRAHDVAETADAIRIAEATLSGV